MLKTISVRLETELLAAVDAAADRSRSDVIREALEDWLKRQRLEQRIRRDRAGYEKYPLRRDEFGPVLDAQVWPK